jgi:AcrR family transcriptional regulator
MAEFTDAQRQLIIAAEQLIAEKGLDAVSDREIARFSGQKNHSAIKYHFGDRRALIEAILDYRMIPLNRLRQQMLDRLDQDEQSSVRDLIVALVMPYAQSIIDNNDSYYVSLLSQLYNQQSDKVFVVSQRRVSSVVNLTKKLHQALPDLDEAALYRRLRLAGTVLIHTVAIWDHQRRLHPARWHREYILEQADSLVDFICGGLVSATSSIQKQNGLNHE